MPFASSGSRRFKQEEIKTTVVLSIPTKDVERLLDYIPLYANSMPQELFNVLYNLREQLGDKR